MGDHHTRHCASCNTALAADNRDDLCEPWAHAAQVMPDAAPVLPADFWEQPEIRLALLSRHFGRFLRTYRTSQSPQVKQIQLGHWLGITQGQLSRIERSSTPVGDLHKLNTWALVLHVPPDQLWFSPAPTSFGTDHAASNPTIMEESPQDEESDVRRRDLLKVAGVAAVAAGGGVLSDTPWQRLIDSIDRGRPVDTATVQLIHDRTVDLFYADETVPSRELLESTMQHRKAIESLLANSRNHSIRNGLAMAMGETDALAGWLLFDLGRGKDAANAWRSALRVAKETGDGPLAACTLCYWSYLAASCNDTAPAIRLLQQAGEYVPGSAAPATRSWLSAREAEELAHSGDEPAALRAVERALTAFDFARPRSERPWTVFFSASRLGGMTVSTYTTLHHRDTTAAADSLLASLPPINNKVRAIVLSDLTVNAALVKDYDRATTLVSDALRLTTQTETRMAKQRLLALAAALPSTSSTGAVGILRDQIISTLRR
jgi:transcriptional regulator with XRE-family HTH domain/tetratricopeptide (TPR) repeat protein